ncbi:MAG: protein kinase, partial [Myxococcales bacterium]|nr:protein kinase [Myxococcales bacterium]
MGEPARHDDASLRKAEAAAPIARTPFGKYVLVARLGRGGMAEVDLALTTGPGGFRKAVVVKRILADLASERRLVDMFFDEARLAARLSHPHVVQTYEFGEVDGQCFLAMEYLDGQPLHRVLRRCADRGVRMPPALVARIAADALDGLSYAHTLTDWDGTPLGVVHRDVSPQNVFVTYDGVVKVLDFGIAKAATQVVETRVGAIKGKYAYIAPEQARGQRVDARADLWSMGVVLWEALTGRRLFRADSDVATLELTLRGAIPRLREIAPDVPAALDAIVDRALRRELEARYPNAAAMRDDLERWLRALPEPVGREELARYMRHIFADRIGEHSRLIAHVMSDEPTPTTGDAMLPSPAAASPSVSPAPLPSSAEPLPPDVIPPAGATAASGAASSAPSVARRRRWWPVAVVAATALVAGVLAWLTGEQRGTALETARPNSSSWARETSEPPRTTTVVVPDPRVAVPVAVDEAPEPVGRGGSETVAGPESAAQVEATAASDPSTRSARRPGSVRGTTAQRRGGSGPARGTGEPSFVERAAQAAGGELPASAPVGTGFLRLDTVPWSHVTLEGRRLGTTPLLRVELPAGTHTLVLENPELGLRT